MVDFKQAVNAVTLLQDIDNMDILELFEQFGKYSNQQIPQSAVSDFRYSGLSNTDLLMSDYLHKYGIKNLNDIETV